MFLQFDVDRTLGIGNRAPMRSNIFLGDRLRSRQTGFFSFFYILGFEVR
jgi:hypothetical protein